MPKHLWVPILAIASIAPVLAQGRQRPPELIRSQTNPQDGRAEGDEAEGVNSPHVLRC